MTELVLPLVLRLEKAVPLEKPVPLESAVPPTRTDALEAAAKAVLHMLTCDRWPEQVAAWDGQRIRKVVRRARGADWRRAEALDGLTISSGTAQVRVYPPIPVDGWPPELARLQVGGTDLADPQPPGRPDPAVPTVLLSPQLTMTAGKAMAQAGHAAQLGWRAASAAARERWRAGNFPIAVRDATPVQWAAGLYSGVPVVRDAGFTEVEPGARTALFLRPQSSDW